MPTWANTPGIAFGPDPAVERSDGTVATRRRPLIAVRFRLAAGSEQPGTRQLLDTARQAHVDTHRP
jgi:hypothetical protein